MGTRQQNGDRRSPALTRGMRIALAAVIVLVVAAVAISVMLSRSGDAPNVGATAAAPTNSAITPTPGPHPDGTPVAGSEVQPPTATPTSGLPPLPTPTPLVESPLPASASKNGALVDSFPKSIMAPAEDSDILSSSIATEGDRMQVSLVAVSATSPAELSDHYARLWADLGLQHDTTTDGSLRYTGAYESLTFAVEPSGTGNRYTVFGTFRTK